jgi:hypothetical protein
LFCCLLILDTSLYPNFHRLFPSLHPWKTGLHHCWMLMSLLLCIVTPRFPGWNTIVYPASASFGMLISEWVLRWGRTCTCLALGCNHSKGKSTVCVALINFPFGKMTVMFELPVVGKFSANRTKCDVLPESNTIPIPSVFDASLILHR